MPTTSCGVSVPDKPRHHSGYSAEELGQVKAACLTVAVTIGAFLDEVCVVGGLVPALLIDTRRADGADEEQHPGTNDLDVGLALTLLDDERYAELSERLRAEGFKPDTNDNDNPMLQRWRLGTFKVTIDFLMPPAPGQGQARRIQQLQSDFGALITPGLELAFDERVQVHFEGHTLKGERARRSVPVCGPAAFVILKSLASATAPNPRTRSTSSTSSATHQDAAR